MELKKRYHIFVHYKPPQVAGLTCFRALFSSIQPSTQFRDPPAVPWWAAAGRTLLFLLWPIHCLLVKQKFERLRIVDLGFLGFGAVHDALGV